MEDLRVAVTGASSGIGREAARALGREGCRLALIGRSAGSLLELRDEIGDRASVVLADLGVPGGADGAVDASARQLGGLDVLIANAAASAYGPFSEITAEDFRRTIDVSLFGVVDSVRAALPHLERSGGAVVITGSIVRDVSMPLFTPYVTAKGAVRSFADALRAELSAEGSPVDVSLVEPGPVRTGFWDHVTRPGGELPRVPIGSVDAERAGRAVAERVRDPKARSTVGLYALAQRTLARALPSVADRALPLVERFLGSGESARAAGPGTLWRSTDRVEAERGGRARR